MKSFRLLALVAALAAYMPQSRAQRIQPDQVSTSLGSLTIQPINHATFVMTVGGKVIYVDPVGGASIFSGLGAPDMILITDIHGDHMDSATIAAVMKPGTIVVAPQAVADKLPAYEKANLKVMHNGDNATVLGFPITALPMYNLPESPTAMHTKGRGNGYVINIGGKHIYISGDTQGIPEMRSLKNIDIAFVCMNLPYTMDVKEAADAVLAFQPKIVYPYHYRGKDGMSDVMQFKTLVDAGNKGIEVRLRNWYPQATASK
jgi:L-ascorbate metabolism protein UlaG (beta-lactamase superfamily)